MKTQTALIPIKTSNNYAFIDLFKFICALLVVAIHIPPFKDFNPTLSFFFNQVVCRIAVPFFFLCTGFFIKNKIKDSKKIKKYLIKISKFYLLFCITYFAEIIYTYIRSGDIPFSSPINFFKNFFIYGFEQYWYLLATIVGVALLYFLINHTLFKNKYIIFIALFTYILGVVIFAYKTIFNHFPAFYNILQFLQKNIGARGGLFFRISIHYTRILFKLL